MLVYLKGVKGDIRVWPVADVRPRHAARIAREVYAYADASFPDDTSSRKSTLAYYFFVDNNSFSWYL